MQPLASIEKKEKQPEVLKQDQPVRVIPEEVADRSARQVSHNASWEYIPKGKQRFSQIYGEEMSLITTHEEPRSRQTVVNRGPSMSLFHALPDMLSRYANADKQFRICFLKNEFYAPKTPATQGKKRFELAPHSNHVLRNRHDKRKASGWPSTETSTVPPLDTI